MSEVSSFINLMQKRLYVQTVKSKLCPLSPVPLSVFKKSKTMYSLGTSHQLWLGRFCCEQGRKDSSVDLLMNRIERVLSQKCFIGNYSKNPKKFCSLAHILK